uniref:uncharacterized protein n=1 Tax=Myxine glutinosa TaxID=7769 RepID=UPI00358F3488
MEERLAGMRSQHSDLSGTILEWAKAVEVSEQAIPYLLDSRSAAIQKLFDETDSSGCPQWIPDIISRTVASTRMELESLLQCSASLAEIPHLNQSGRTSTGCSAELSDAFVERRKLFQQFLAMKLENDILTTENHMLAECAERTERRYAQEARNLQELAERLQAAYFDAGGVVAEKVHLVRSLVDDQGTLWDEIAAYDEHFEGWGCEIGERCYHHWK